MVNGEVQRAEKLRKEGSFKEAKEIYAILWKNSKEPSIGAGFLHCLRKLNDTEKSISLAYELRNQKFNDYWVNLEILWTLIGELRKSEDYLKAKELARYLLTLIRPEKDILALKIITEKMAKLAMDKENWSEAIEWLEKYGKKNLTDELVAKSEWTNKTLWYFRKIKCLYGIGNYEEIIALSEEVESISKPWNINKQFLRYRAKTLFDLDKLDDSLQLYKKISKEKVEWWILREEALVLIKMNLKDDALKILYTAALSSRQLDKLVTLFNDIGNLCLVLNKEEEALAHYILEKLIREENKWSIDSTLTTQINSLKNSFPEYNEISKVKDALDICRKFWKKLGIQPPKTHSKKGYKYSSKKDDRKTRKGLKGIVQKKKELPFFFIKTENESIICFLSDITEEYTHGDEVLFDALPSFDKKRNMESWKAINLKKLKKN